MKTCNKCDESKPFDSYYRNCGNKDGRMGHCKPCDNEYKKSRPKHVQRKYQLAQKFNVTLEWYETQKLAGCAICGTTDPGRQDFAVDHNHDCCPGKGSCGECVRGVLCNPCNLAIGMMKDNPDTLRLAADYLETYERISQ